MWSEKDCVESEKVIRIKWVYVLFCEYLIYLFLIESVAGLSDLLATLFLFLVVFYGHRDLFCEIVVFSEITESFHTILYET